MSPVAAIKGSDDTIACASKDGRFDTAHLKDSLKSRSLRGGAITLTSQGAKAVLKIGSTAILARLLTPADFGLIGMVAAFTGFAGLFRDLGLSMATVQREHITHRQVSFLFWINVLASVVLAVVCSIMAPLVAWFYGEPDLFWVTIAVSGTFIFGGFTAQHTALIRRQMRFGALCVIDITGTVVGMAVGIWAAWRGIGYWALVVMEAVNACAAMVLAWLFSGWVPGLPRRNSGVRAMVAFGGHLTASNVLDYVAKNLDCVLIGRVCGAQALGFYTRAFGLMNLPMRQLLFPVMAVMGPAFCRMANDPKRFRRAILSLMEKAAFVGTLATVLLLACADWIVRLLLGPGWEEAARIFAVLGVFALVEPVSSIAASALVTTGQAKRYLHVKAFNTVLIVAGMVVGLPWGPMGVASCYALSGLFIRMPVLLWYVGRHTVVSARSVWMLLVPYLAVSFTVLIGLSALRWGVEFTTPLLGLTVVGGTGIAAYLGAVCMLASGRRNLREIKSAVMSLTSRSRHIQ